jgi:hypothetical protein
MRCWHHGTEEGDTRGPGHGCDRFNPHRRRGRGAVGHHRGGWLWDLFARQIYAVPEPTVPRLWVVAIALGALVLANVVAAMPARAAARTPTALLLRAE